MREIELKFLLGERDDKALRASPALKELSRGEPRRRLLRSIYYDTPDRALSARGIALRLRKDGRRWVQTVKRGPRSVTGGLSAPEEAEAPAPRGEVDLDRIPDGALRRLVREAVGEARLEPVFETSITRVTRHLALPGGLAELALDKGSVIAGDRSEPLIEAELELLDGDPAVLYDIAARLFAEVPVRLSDRSKAARGHALAEGGRAVPPSVPVRAREAFLSPDDSAEEAALKVLRSCLDQIAANAAACLECDEPEGPHQLRVGLRRLRSAFGLFGSALAGPEAESLDACARELGAEVGALRDLDVLATDVLAPAAAAAVEDDAQGFKTLIDAVEDRRVAARKRVREVLTGPSTSAFLLDLSRFVELRGWLRPEDHEQTRELAAPILDLARAALAKRWRKVRKKARGLERLSVDERHELRKELKKLRYGVDFFGMLFAKKRVKPFRKRLKRLQEVFGALNDSAAAEAALAGPDAPARNEPAAQRAAGRVLGERRRDSDIAWEEARADWDALRALKPFWA